MMKNTKNHNESAVSPVVGVMLMLVVTIIIAAVVSAFAGGLTTGEKKAPSVAIETHITNTGMFTSSGMTMTMKSASEAIPTKDVKLVTSWSTTCKYTKTDDPGNPTGSCATVGAAITGGNTTIAGVNNTKFYNYNAHTAPYGIGPGAKAWGLYQDAPTVVEGLYGNYSLVSGTSMRAYPVGPFVSYLISMGGGYSAPPSGPLVASYKYYAGGLWNPTQFDSMQAVLGKGWENLRAGDIVNVKLIHIPSGKVIYDAKIAVEGSQ